MHLLFPVPLDRRADATSSSYTRTMLLRIDAASAQPIHDQLTGQIRQHIAAGTLAAGAKLPAARDLASSLGVNVHTLLRAYQALRYEGLLEVRRGRGTIVTGTAPLQAQFVAKARELVAEARRAGLSDQDIRHTLEAQL